MIQPSDPSLGVQFPLQSLLTEAEALRPLVESTSKAVFMMAVTLANAARSASSRCSK